jgi:hypothetical protein
MQKRGAITNKNIEQEDRTIPITKLEKTKSQHIRLGVRAVLKVQLPYRQLT